MKKYLVIAVLVIIGVTASLLLVPGTNEIALMQMKDKRYDEARKTYEQKRAEGNLTVDVVSALTDLYLQYGAVNDAIEVMEEFVEKNPDNLQARKELGKLYQYAQRPDDYLKNLEVVNKLEGSKENLGTMVAMYGASQQYDKQEPALEVLVEHNVTKEPHHYRQLVSLQASEKHYAEAVASLREFRQKFPAEFQFPEYELLVTLLLDDAKQEEAYAEAKEWVRHVQENIQEAQKAGAETKEVTQKGVSEIARLVNILHYRGNPQLAMRLLEPYDAQVQQFPELATEKAYILVNTGKRQEAYDLIAGLYEQGRLPQSLQRDYMALALENGKPEVARELAKKLDVSTLNEEQSVSVVELALYSSDNELRNTLLDKYDDTSLVEDKPVLKAMLSIARRSNEVDADIAALHDVEMTPQRVFMLASACAANHYNQCTNDMLARVQGQKLEGEDTLRAANLYLQIGQIASAREIIDPLYATTPQDPTVSALRAKIAAYEGDTVFVDRWIAAQSTISMKEYKELFFMAQDYKKTDTALFVAEKMHAQYNNTESRTLLVNAYMAEKRYEAALPYLRELKSYSERDRNDYMAVLMDLSKKNPKYRTELANFAATELRNNRVPARQKQALIYALLDAGRADIALPYIKEFARTQGGDWVEVYAQNLDKLGHRDEARDFRVQIANDPHSSAKTRRDMGFVLLDKGYKEDSMAVFANLAADAPASSTDVQQLLYLWGPRLTAEQLDWMTQRALNAPDAAERNQWVKYISGYADSDEMVSLVERNPDMIGDPVLLDTYLNSLYRLGKLESMQDRVSKLAEKTNNTALLRAYARSLYSHNMTRQAQAAYKKLNKVTGGDPESERNLGLMAFNQADYSETKKYLQNYVNFRAKNQRYHKDDYQAYFYLAESYRRDRDLEKATPYYRKSLELLSKTSGRRSGDMEARAAQSMVALGDKQSGYKIFEDAMKRMPNDQLLRADYVSTLIEEKDYDKAKMLTAAAKPDQLTVTEGEANPLMLKVSNIQGYRTFSGDNEILLEFKGEDDTRTATLTPEDLKNYPWLSYSTQGYDRALLVAKPEYRLKLEPTSGGYMIVPQTDSATTSPDFKFRKDLALRYKMLMARIDLETGKHYQATDELRKELPANSNNGTLLGYSANAENFVGRWKRALRLLDRAQQVMPENEDIQILRRDIRRVHSEHAKIDYEWFKLGDSRQNIWTASGLKFIDDEIEVGGNVQFNDLKARNIRRVDGRQGNFNENATRAEVFVAKETEDGKRIQGSLFANDDFAGAGAYYSWYNNLGRTQVYGEYHRPNWDFVEGVLDSAVRDSLGIEHFMQINPLWNVNGGIALNRYHTQDKTNVADTVSLNGVLTRQLKAINPYLAANYALDAEYRADDGKRLDAAGVTYEPLVQSREVHSVSLIAAKELSEDTDAMIQAGYSYDRMTDANGPLVAGELTHNMLDDRLEAELRASYGAFTKDNVGDSARLGGYLKWRF